MYLGQDSCGSGRFEKSYPDKNRPDPQHCCCAEIVTRKTLY
jgi:hypothetical protein